MAFTPPVFDPAVPTGDDLVSNMDTFINNLKTQILERLRLEHYSFITTGTNAGNATDTALTAHGRHIPGNVRCVFVGTTSDISTLTGMTLGCLAYDTTKGQLQVYNGSDWTTYVSSAGTCAFSMRKTTGTMSASTPQLVVMDTVDFGVSYCTVGTGKVTIPTTGLYQINFALSATYATSKAQVAVYKNGLSLNIPSSWAMNFTTNGTNVNMINGSMLVSLAATDYLQLYYLHESGGTHTITAQISGYRVA